MDESQAAAPKSANAVEGGGVATQCPYCHSWLPGDAPFGVCPRCLLSSALPQSMEWPGDLDPGFLDPIERPGILGLLDGYIVLSLLGGGANGIVFKAEDPSLGRRVAIKVLRPALAASNRARERFLGEARAIAAVSHENIVAIHAVGEWKELPYLVMSCVSGMTLSERIRRSGPLEPVEILRIGHQIAAGLAKAHSQGVVHRDLTPGNVMLENTVERVKLTDFGFARLAEGEELGPNGFIFGTPGFMAPEQYGNGPVDERADLFAVGCILYAMGTGESPFHADDAAASFRSLEERRIIPLTEANPELPSSLGALVERLLQKEPNDRVQSAAELEGWFARQLAHKDGHASAPAHRLSSKALVWSLIALLILILAWTWRPGQQDRELPPTKALAIGMSPGPVDSADLGRFEALFNLLHADEQNALPSRAPAPAFADPESDKLEQLIFVGSRPLEEQGSEFVKLHHERICEKFMSDPSACFVLLVIGESEEEDADMRDFLPRMRAWRRSGGLPAGGAWVAGVRKAETLALLPESRRQPHLELWIAVSAR